MYEFFLGNPTQRPINSNSGFSAEQNPQGWRLRWSENKSQPAWTVRHTSTKLFASSENFAMIVSELPDSKRESKCLSSSDFITAARLVQIFIFFKSVPLALSQVQLV
jgi:hypothetical protein